MTGTRSKVVIAGVAVLALAAVVLAVAACNSAPAAQLAHVTSPASPSAADPWAAWCASGGFGDEESVNSDVSRLSTDYDNGLSNIADDAGKLMFDANAAKLNPPPSGGQQYQEWASQLTLAGAAGDQGDFAEMETTINNDLADKPAAIAANSRGAFNRCTQGARRASRMVSYIRESCGAGC